jgi:hypothetical protein
MNAELSAGMALISSSPTTITRLTCLGSREQLTPGALPLEHGENQERGRAGCGRGCFRRTMLWLISAILLSRSGCFQGALAQGALQFTNYAPGWGPPVDAPVFGIDGVTPLAGAAYLAQLYAGPAGSAESSLSPIDEPVPFRTGLRAGYWESRLVEVPSVFPGQTATLQVRVWEAVAGSFDAAQAGAGHYGSSRLLQIELGSQAIGVLPPLEGLESFSLVPEPGSISLGVMGMALFWLTRQRGGAQGFGCAETPALGIDRVQTQAADWVQ